VKDVGPFRLGMGHTIPGWVWLQLTEAERQAEKDHLARELQDSAVRQYMVVRTPTVTVEYDEGNRRVVLHAEALGFGRRVG
jgi:hypothetical protein